MAENHPRNASRSDDKSTGLARTIPAVAACLTLVLVLAAIPGASAATVVVAPTQLDVWQARHGSCGAPTTGNQTFEVGPAVPPLGTGSLEFQVGSNGDSFETFRHSGLNGTLLSDITALSYSTYTDVDGVGGQAVYIMLAVSTTGGTTVDDQLFFEPAYQSGMNASIPDQGPLVVDTWQSWDALAGGWWSSSGNAGANPGADVRTLAEYAEAFPDAVIIDGTSGGVRLATGCGSGAWPGFVGNVDNVTIGSDAFGPTTYDFEPVAPTTTTSTSSSSTSSSSSSTATGTTTTATNTTTPQIPVFPTAIALGIALVGGLGGAFLMMRRRMR